MPSSTLDGYIPINCYNPSCGESFANAELRARHCGAVPACRQARLEHFSSDSPPAVKRRRTRIEVVEDEDEHRHRSQIPHAYADVDHDTNIDMEGQALGRPTAQSADATGPPPNVEPNSWSPEDQEHARRQHGAPYKNGRFDSLFERLRAEQKTNRQSPFGVFEDEEHWELVEWIVESGLSAEYVERLLKLKIVSLQNLYRIDKRLTFGVQLKGRLKPSFSSRHRMNKKLEEVHGLDWTVHDIDIVGDKKDEHGRKRTETVQLFMRDINECVKELMGNPVFRDHMRYSFSKFFLVDAAGICHRAYNEIWDSDWMCEVEVRVRIELSFSHHDTDSLFSFSDNLILALPLSLALSLRTRLD
jgi:hypothetical protein